MDNDTRNSYFKVNYSGREDQKRYSLAQVCSFQDIILSQSPQYLLEEFKQVNILQPTKKKDNQQGEIRTCQITQNRNTALEQKMQVTGNCRVSGRAIFTLKLRKSQLLNLNIKIQEEIQILQHLNNKLTEKLEEKNQQYAGLRTKNTIKMYFSIFSTSIITSQHS